MQPSVGFWDLHVRPESITGRVSHNQESTVLFNAICGNVLVPDGHDGAGCSTCLMVYLPHCLTRRLRSSMLGGLVLIAGCCVLGLCVLRPPGRLLAPFRGSGYWRPPIPFRTGGRLLQLGVEPPPYRIEVRNCHGVFCSIAVSF